MALEIRKYPPVKLSHYPHLWDRDVHLWERFIDQYGNRFTQFAYDVRVGDGIEVDPSWPEWLQYDAKVLTQKRIDVVGYQPSTIWIFEVKPYAGLSAVGQVVGYMTLFSKQFKPSLPLQGAIVTDVPQPDIDKICQELKIIIFRV